jgi:hypothetical protein
VFYKGKQIVDALNMLGIHAAAIGNHEFGKKCASLNIFGCLSVFEIFIKTWVWKHLRHELKNRHSRGKKKKIFK